MLPKPYRLTGSRVLSHAHFLSQYHSVSFQLVFTKISAHVAQFAVVVPKRLDSRSSHRNITKRLIRNILFDLVCHTAGGVGIVVRMKRLVAKHERRRVLEELVDALQRTGYWRGTRV